jgi:hypothetical protein
MAGAGCTSPESHWSSRCACRLSGPGTATLRALPTTAAGEQRERAPSHHGVSVRGPPSTCRPRLPACCVCGLLLPAAGLPSAFCLLPPASCLLPPASAALFVFLVVLGRLGSSCVMYSIHRERSNDTATPVRLQPRLASPRLASPHHTTPHYTTLHRTTPHRTTPHLTSPHPSPAALPCAPGDALSAHQRPSGALCVRILRKLMPYHAARLPAPSASRRLCKSPQTVSLGGPRAPEAGN